MNKKFKIPETCVGCGLCCVGYAVAVDPNVEDIPKDMLWFAKDPESKYKAIMKIVDGANAHPYIEILAIQHGSWNTSLQTVRVAYIGTDW